MEISHRPWACRQPPLKRGAWVITPSVPRRALHEASRRTLQYRSRARARSALQGMNARSTRTVCQHVAGQLSAVTPKYSLSEIVVVARFSEVGRRGGVEQNLRRVASH